MLKWQVSQLCKLEAKCYMLDIYKEYGKSGTYMERQREASQLS